MAALAFGAVTNVLYARLLAPEQIGRLAILVAAATGIVVVADGGLQLFLTRAIARGETRAGAASGALLSALPVNVCLVWLVVVGGEAITSSLWGAFVGRDSLVLVIELALSLVLYQVGLTLYQGLGWFGGRAWLLVGNGVATTAITAAMLTIDQSVSTAVHATAAAYLALGVAAIACVQRRHGLVKVPFRDVRRWLRQARGLWLNSGLGFITTSADVLLAATVMPIAAVGYYQVLKKLSLAILAPLAAVLPLVYSHLAASSRERQSSFVRRVEFAGVGSVAVGLLIAAPYVQPLVEAVFGTTYADHAAILLALVAIGAIQFSHNLLGYVCAAAGEFYRPLWMNITVAASGAALSAGLAVLIGMRGFLIGLAVANALGVVLGLLLTRHLLDYSARRAAFTAGVFVAAAALIAYALLRIPLAPSAVLGAASATAAAGILGRVFGRPSWLARKATPVVADSL